MDSEREEMLQKIGKLFGASPISDSFMETVSENDSDPHRIQLCNMLRVTTVAEVEVLEKIKMHVREMGIALDPRNLKKYLVSRLRMDGHEASFCRTSWVFTFGRTKGGPEGPSEVLQFTCHHEYIDVMVKDGDDPTRLIGDMNFRSQFELARSTETYKELTKFIPRESDLDIPPWRKTSYMQSKWLSKVCKKESAFTDMDLAHMGMGSV
ncbi:hypothetical protein CJ030_MR3G025364 [Morella rubra]|uniref:Uncharacterized protein n=1 Tax=Morella rubra TaxID=262757 RepID=A0A6A1W712_9ROSI|nr:hypothetical protein CJ030_MR3G025364 [Morella rubra]